jgi:hypothetical protein
MILRSERVGGRGLESFPVEGAEGAGEDRGDGQQPEGRQRAQHEREEEQHGHAPGPDLGLAPPAGPGLDAHPVEDGGERSALAEVVDQGPHEGLGRLPPAPAEIVDGVDRRGAAGHGSGGLGQRGAQARRSPPPEDG